MNAYGAVTSASGVFAMKSTFLVKMFRRKIKNNETEKHFLNFNGFIKQGR